MQREDGEYAGLRFEARRSLGGSQCYIHYVRACMNGQVSWEKCMHGTANLGKP